MRRQMLFLTLRDGMGMQYCALNLQVAFLPFSIIDYHTHYFLLFFKETGLALKMFQRIFTTKNDARGSVYQPYIK